jgi:tRNA U34 5-methylaminomethyl-2-thiouridine-forming methyltransferase MnmC
MNPSEYLVELKKLLTYDIKEMTKSGANVSESYFVDKALDYLEKMHSPLRRAGSTTIMDFLFGSNETQSLCVPKVWKEIGTEVEKHIADTLKQYRSKKMVTEIRQLAAKAQIEEAMNGTGLTYLILPQTYRAKVAVKLGQKNKVVFYVSYKRTAEDLERCIGSAKALVELIDSLGTGASIQKLMPYENW